MTPPVAVLCVDDEASNLEVFRASFPQFDVRVCDSGAAALESITRARPDVIVTDQRMPGMSGIELLEEVRRREPTICRFMLTAYEDAVVREHNGAGKCGCIEHHYLKPCDLRVIATDIAEAVVRRALRATMAHFYQIESACTARNDESLALLEQLRR